MSRKRGAVLKKYLFIFFSMCIMFCFFGNSTASAETGDFYERHESDFELYTDKYKDFIKAYDLETNTFDCGAFEVYCHMNSPIYSGGIGLLNFVITGLDTIVVGNDWFLKEPKFQAYKGYFNTMTTTMLAIFLTWQIMAGYAQRFTNMDEMDTLINEKFLKACVGAAFLALYDPILSMILDVQNSSISGILKMSVDIESFALVVFRYTTNYGYIVIIFIGLVLTIFLIALTYRFIAFSFMYVAGVLAIPTIVNEEFNYFNIWFRYIINSAVTLILQSICFTFAIGCLTVQYSFLQAMPLGVEVVMGIILSLGFAIFALVIPGILGNLGNSSGTGRTLGKLVRFAAIRR